MLSVAQVGSSANSPEFQVRVGIFSLHENLIYKNVNFTVPLVSFVYINFTL